MYILQYTHTHITHTIFTILYLSLARAKICDERKQFWKVAEKVAAVWTGKLQRVWSCCMASQEIYLVKLQSVVLESNP